MSKLFFTALKLFCFSVFIVITLSQCSTKKDGLTKRVFHNTTARYNGFFNAKEAKKEALLSLEESQEDDYDSLLTIFFYPTKDNVGNILESMDAFYKSRIFANLII